MAVALASVAAAAIVVGSYYFKYARLIDRRLAAGAFSDTVDIYSSPRLVAVGDALTAETVVARLRHSGYSTGRGNPIGWYNLRANAVEIFPGKDSYSGGDSAVLYFANGKISRIVALTDNTARNQYLLEPLLITNLSQNNEKRRLVRFSDLPTVLVDAVISAEDKRFFYHDGIDVLRLVKAAYVDLKEGRKEQGASTLSMQLARGLWLEPAKHWKRKLAELAITLHLEEKLTKQQIFEDYANQVYMGRRGPFSINGLGEAARAYLGKDVSQLNAPEAALLAGMIQRPSYFNPYRYPERAVERRNLVLALMRDNGYLNRAEYEAAVAGPLQVATEHSESLETSYFLNVVNEELQSRLEDHDRRARYVYTTLDPDLQTMAEEAVHEGMERVDAQLRKRRNSRQPGEPQVALVALDPHTGEVKALVGGRNYAESQLNHALAMRQPGSLFKPFVYAAALNTAITGGGQIFTPASMIEDSPTTFYFDNQSYSPDNFAHEFMGDVTLRTALAHSLNAASVKLAEEVGFEKVVALARRCGLNNHIQPTPAVALGSYETSPLEMAGAYTTFANDGKHLTPAAVALVRSRAGRVLYDHTPDPQSALDPRVNYLIVNMMQEVLSSGTAAGARSQGFTLTAAGKTGTSRDGWFAGFTSNLLCLVWVGFDDDHDLNLEGAKSALPIWTAFMKRATKLRAYRDARPFAKPSGVVQTSICSDSGQLAGPACPRTRTEVFIEGTEPAVRCQMHSPERLPSAERVMETPAPSAPAEQSPSPSPPTWEEPAPEADQGDQAGAQQ